jgi:hypothetical protein
MTIPVYVFAVICVLVVACKLQDLPIHLMPYLADPPSDWSERTQQRTPFIMGGFSIAVAGFIGMLVSRRHPEVPGVSYFFLFLVAAGLYCPFICIVCLIGNNLAPSSKRAVGMAQLISFGNLGGICGSNIFLAAQAPRYPTGFGTGMGICLCAIVMAWVLRKAYARENAKRDGMLAEEGEEAIRARYTEEELLAMGDKSPFFRYTL